MTTYRWKSVNLARKVWVFFAGVRHAVTHDRNMLVQLIISLTVLAVTFWLRNWFDFVLIVIATGHMLVVEMVNTAIEAICDYIQPEYDGRIGAIKDMGSAASGIAILIWSITMLYEGVRIWSSL